MRIINANGEQLTIARIREALKGLPERAIARLHPTQQEMYALIGIEVQSVISEPDHTKPYAFIPCELIPSEMTMGGHRIVIDSWLPEDRVRFEVDDKPIIAIINLSVPTPYEAVR